MTTPITDNLIIIPSYLYNDALDYLPKRVVEDMIQTVMLSDHTEIPVHDITRAPTVGCSESMRLIRRHNKSKLPKYTSAVPSMCLGLTLLIAFSLGYILTPEVLLLGGLLTVVSTFYLFELRQAAITRYTFADNILTAIKSHVLLEVKQKMIDNLTTTNECQAREIELYRIDQTEMNVRYQSVFDYFSQCSPKETKAYVAGLEDSHVTVHTHRGMQ